MSFADLLPACVVAVDVTGSVVPTPLFAEEAQALGNVVPKRRLEFTLGQHCAREALRLVGLTPRPILVGRAREPLWPSEVVGSITHAGGFYAAAVARRLHVASIGIDTETHEVLPPGVLAEVASDEERGALQILPRVRVCWDRVLFSAKESVFKAWYPVASRWLGFQDVRLVIRPELTNPACGRFEAQLLGLSLDVGGRAVTCLEGRYSALDEHILTAVVVHST